MKVATPSHPRLSSGMTLLEIVIVLGIIAIIIAAGIGPMRGLLGGAEATAAEMKIKSLSAAVESYKLSGGRYPTQDQGLKALVEKPTTSPEPRRWRQQLQTIPVDPWQNEFVYKYPGSKDRSTYEIISKGDDGEIGTDDDISSQDPQ